MLGITFTRYGLLKWTIYALLGLNLYFYLVHGTLNEVLDTAGWLLLLSVFEYETGHPSKSYKYRWEGWLVLAAQIIAYVLIIYALVGYFRESEWEDFINATLWLLVVATLAYDVYAPGQYGGLELRIRNGLKMALYVALFIIALYWGVTGEVLDFYDAALWIVCFLIIELNIFHIEKPAARDVGIAQDSATAAQ